MFDDMEIKICQKIWAEEAEKRLKAYKAGKLKTVSFEDMLGANQITIFEPRRDRAT